LVANALNALPQAKLAVGDVHQLQVGANEVLVGGNDVKAIEGGGYGGVPRRGVAQDDMVEAGAIGSLAMPRPLVALPWGSESMTRILRSFAASAAARLMAVVVLRRHLFGLRLQIPCSSGHTNTKLDATEA